MPYNKQAYLRHKAIDKCLKNRIHGYSLQQLKEVCNDALSLNCGKTVTIRTIQNDLNDLRYDYGAEIKETWENGIKYFSYADDDFSILSTPITEEERALLDMSLSVLSKFQSDLTTELSLKIKEDNIQKTVVAFDDNINTSGHKWLEFLYQCINQKQVIEIVYKPFTEDKVKIAVSPYFIKQYNRRWYLIAGLSDGTMHTYAIDERFINCKAKQNIKYLETDIDFNEYFDDVVGVTIYNDKPIEKVILAVKKHRYPYLESTPIHVSQTKLNHFCSNVFPSEEYIFVRLNVIINYELINKILYYGNDMVVLEPISLKSRIKQYIEEMYNNYQK